MTLAGAIGGEAAWIAALATVVLLALLAAATWIDLKTQRIPDGLNAALGAVGLGVVWALGGDLLASLVGIVAGYAFLALANALYRWRRGRDGLGMGDAKLLAAAGAWLGWALLPFVTLAAAASGLAAMAIDHARGKPVVWTTSLAFGPHLCFGVALAWGCLLALALAQP